MSDYNNFLDGTLFNRIFSGRSRNNKYISQPDFSYPPLTFQKQEQWVSITGNELDIYHTTPELRMVFDRMANMFANGVFIHLDKNGKVIENSEVVDRLENPNVFQSRNEFLFQLYLQRLLYPSTFMYNLYGSSLQEIPSAMWNLSPSRMKINRTGKIWKQTEMSEIISGYTFKNDAQGKDEQFTTDEIIQFGTPDPDDPIMGRSILEALRMPISNIRSAYGYRNTILTKKGAIGVWSSDAKDSMGAISLTPKEETQLTQSLVKNYGTGDHQNSIAISSKALKWNPSTYPTKDLMLFEEIDANKRAIIDMVGANDNMFSKTGGSKFDNILEGEKIAYQDTLDPIGQEIAGGIAKRWGIEDRGESLILSFDHVAPLKQDESVRAGIVKTKAESAKILSELGVYTPEQIRTIVDFDLE